MTGERTREKGGDAKKVEEKGEKSERQSGWLRGWRASLGKLPGLESVKISLNVVQEVQVKLEFESSSLFVEGSINYVVHTVYIFPFFKRIKPFLDKKGCQAVDSKFRKKE